MKKQIKRIIDLRHLFIPILMIIFLAMNDHIVSAEKQKDNPYLIKVNRSYNTITIYEKGDTEEYDVPVKAMICSVGVNGMQTKKGTFTTKGKYRWKNLMGDVWGQYSTRIVGGILFHSVYYYGNSNPATLATNQFNKLGSAASHGCIRLSVGDAKWIYDNCPVGTTVTIYDNKKSPGPLGKPEAIRIPASVRWDPTDPNEKNPYKDKKPIINGVKDLSIPWGKELNLLKGISAKSSLGNDITSKIDVNGEVDVFQPGDYKVTYQVTDSLGRTKKKTITITVKENEEPPRFEGIEDRVVGKDTIIDEEYALTGVKVYCSNVRISIKNVKVTITNVSNNEYKLTYSVSIGKKVTGTKTATIYIDDQAPVFTGVSDRKLEPGQIPDGAFALKDVTVTDNYTTMDVSDINVKMKQNPDGSYLVTYEAVDKVGNSAIVTVIFSY